MKRPRSEQRRNSEHRGLRPARGRPFSKGQSGNPGGRPRGFGALIREATDDGEELVRTVLAVLRSRRTAARDRLRAAEFLADRGWGRPSQAIELEPSAPLTFSLDIDNRRLAAVARRSAEVLERGAAKAEEA